MRSFIYGPTAAESPCPVSKEQRRPAWGFTELSLTQWPVAEVEAAIILSGFVNGMSGYQSVMKYSAFSESGIGAITRHVDIGRKTVADQRTKRG